MATWLRQPALTATLALASAIAVAALSPQTDFMQAQRANQAAMREYTWKSRTELTLKGETKRVTLELVRYDIDGRLQKTRIGGEAAERKEGLALPPGPAAIIRNRIVAKRTGDFEDLLHELAALAASYASLSPDRLQDFAARATMSQGEGPMLGTIRIHGRDVLTPADAMNVWIDPRGSTTRRTEIATTLDGKPVDVVIDFRTLDNGLTYPARRVLRYPEKSLELVVETFEYQHTGTR
jgi:hypothetical protein